MVSANIEIEVSNPSAMGPVECIGRSIVVVEVLIIGIKQQRIGIDIVELRVVTGTIVGTWLPTNHIAILIEVELVESTHTLIIRQPVLRTATQRIGSREDLVEVATLMIVEAQI